MLILNTLYAFTWTIFVQRANSRDVTVHGFRASMEKLSKKVPGEKSNNKVLDEPVPSCVCFFDFSDAKGRVSPFLPLSFCLSF